MRLENKVAVVTGAAQGIGRAIARRFAAEGARVVVADIQEDKGAETAAHIREAGGEARFVACDVTLRAQVDALVEETVGAFGRLDVLVNDAAVIHTADFLGLAEEDFDRVLSVNLKGPFLAGQAAARQMVKQGDGGAIVNMSSVNAVLAIADQVPYSVSKGGIAQLTRVMALALAPHGIRVNAIGPGTIDTEMGHVVMADAAARRRIFSRTPMGRLGTVDEVAAVAVFLAGAESSYMTGQTVYCDGGRLPLNYTVPVPEDA